MLLFRLFVDIVFVWMSVSSCKVRLCLYLSLAKSVRLASCILGGGRSGRQPSFFFFLIITYPISNVLN
jgi:hypothetical protein